MLRVHHLEHSRSQRVLWLLEELELPYEVVRYARDPKTSLAPPELKRVHPLGKSPLVEDDGAVLAETGAIVEALLERYGAGRLTPSSESGRQALRYWLHYAEGSAMTPLLLKLVFTRLPERASGFGRMAAKGVAAKALSSFVDPQVKSHVDWWETSLASTGWFAGPDFSAADIMMSFPVEAAGSRVGYGADRPGLKAFLDRIHARPAYRRALERGGPYAYA